MDEGDLDLLACRAVRIRPRPATRFVETAGYVLAAFLSLPLLASGNVGLGGVLVALLGFSVYRSFASRRRRGGWVKLEPDGLRVTCGGVRRSWTRGQVVGAYRLPLALGATLQMANGSELVFELSPDDDLGPTDTVRTERTLANVERVLSHVGMGPSQRAVRAPLRGTLGAFTKGLVMFFFGGLATLFAMGLVPGRAGLTGLAALAVTCAMTALVVVRFGFPHVVVGADGIRIRGGLRTRFIRFSDVGDVRATHERHPSGHGMLGVQVMTATDSYLLPLVGQSREQQTALVERIRQGRASYVATESGRALEALDRAGRPVLAWKADLQRLAASEGGFRQQPLAKDDFERVLADPRAPLERRVGAALALRVVDPSAGERIRVAGESSADERVAAALQAASEGHIDEAALEGADAAGSEKRFAS